MQNTDWRKYSYRNLNGKRRDNEKSQSSAKTSFMSRIGVAIFAVLVVLLKNIPTGFFDSFTDIMPSVFMVLIVVFPVAAALIIFLFAIRRRKRDAMESRQARRFDSQNEGWNEAQTKPEERYTAYTCTSSDYSGAVDSWEVKDPKPPWEL